MIYYQVEMENIDKQWFVIVGGGGITGLRAARRKAKARKRQNMAHPNPFMKDLNVRIVKIEILEIME